MHQLDLPKPSPDGAALEQGAVFSPRFDANGLITAIVTDSGNGAVLMVAHMNAQSLSLTLQEGVAHFWSRSRNALWKKGETSGNVLQVDEMLTDCDQDVVLLKVTVKGDGAACHTGRRSCFYRKVELAGGAVRLTFDTSQARIGAGRGGGIPE